MFGSKNILGIVLLAILLLGCVISPSTKVADKSTLGYEINNSVKYGLSSSDFSSGGNEQLSTLSIYSKRTNERWQFPLSDYNNQFEAVGLASDSFVRINNSLLKGLDKEEEIWITPYIREANHTLLFNAIYSRPIPQGSDYIMILGKNYSVAALSEKSYSAFELDDKWKIRVEGNCESDNPLSSYCDFKPTKIVIFLDGYLSDLKDGEQINLFRNDNTVLFQFDGINSKPNIKLVYTKPVSSLLQSPSLYFDHFDFPPYNFTEKQEVNSNGTKISFEPGISNRTMVISDTEYFEEDLSYAHLPIKIKDQTYVILDFQPNKSVTLGHEKSHYALYTRDCMIEMYPQDYTYDPYDGLASPTYLLVVGGNNLTLTNFSFDDVSSSSYYSYNRKNFFVDDNNRNVTIAQNETYSVGNESIKFWHYGIGYTYCANVIYASIIDEKIELSSQNGVELKWGNHSSLDEIYIPNNVSMTNLIVD